MSLQEITNALNKWYYTEIKALAVECLREHYDFENDCLDDESAQDWLHETIDGHEFVIYTYKAQLVCATSSNDKAYKDLGFENTTDEQRAYCAMMADVQEYLSNKWTIEELREAACSMM